MAAMVQTPPELLLATVEEWRDWLAEHEDDPVGVRLVLARKGRPAPTTITYATALQEALCSGWIDAQAGRRDEDTFTQRFGPRRPRSIWSLRNVEHVARLTEEGRMRPRGLAEVERARADGRWQAAYAGPAEIEVPAALTAALAAEPAAQAMWDVLTSQNRYAILHRMHIVKREETRAARLVQYVAMLARGETLYPQRRRPADDPAAAAPPAVPDSGG